MNVSENIKNGKYTTKLSYDFIPESIHDDMTINEVHEIEENNKKNAVEWRRKYLADVKHLESVVFREDLAKAYGFVGHPNEPLVWNKAWSIGRPSGLDEVLNWYKELSEFIILARLAARDLLEKFLRMENRLNRR